MEETARLAEQVELAGKADPEGTEHNYGIASSRVALTTTFNSGGHGGLGGSGGFGGIGGTLVLQELEGQVQALVVRRLPMAPLISAV